MLMSLPYVYRIGLHGSVEDKYRLAVSTDIQTLALPDGIVLRSDVSSYFLSVTLFIVVRLARAFTSSGCS